MSQSITVQPIAEGVYAAPQLTPEAMAAAAEAGFKAVMNNRPDFEGGADQPTSATIEAAALAAGLAYAHLPVQGGYQSPEEIARCAELLNSLPRPLLMFCRSGARSTKLYQQAISLED
ncbi:MAG: TIGR01244 family phosphatase [Burkholderiales bacterium]|nr:TIGR01244 family phosphatase [Burkholderiales bacterium]MDE2077158.1 TIGR01244 family phosphatase [Burkholderiales bacterium]MDE2434115.1 TIGR01244 family phosphatase [Burkholderiales bacterium]HET8693453.1 TIGR01244 family sulfur transferase [Aquabacterium sp.]